MEETISPVLKLLLGGEGLSHSQMAEILNWEEAQVEAELDRLRSEDILLGFRPILNPSKMSDAQVRAVIEIRISPEREGGFDRLALRVSRFDEVQSCFLMSGAYDLLVFAEGPNLHSVASFVSEKLATLGGVISTSTHFLLRPYKEQGHLLRSPDQAPDKPSVSP